MIDFSYITCFKYLSRLANDIKRKEDGVSSDVDKLRKDDISSLRFGTGRSYKGYDQDIKGILIKEELIEFSGDNLIITSKGKIFIKKYSGCFGRLELLAKDYPFLIGALLFGMFGGFIGNGIIELTKCLL